MFGNFLYLPSPSLWLIQAIRFGSAIQFARHPPWFTLVADKDAPFLHAKIAVLLEKDTIEPDPPANMKSGVYLIVPN